MVKRNKKVRGRKEIRCVKYCCCECMRDRYVALNGLDILGLACDW